MPGHNPSPGNVTGHPFDPVGELLADGLPPIEPVRYRDPDPALLAEGLDWLINTHRPAVAAGEQYAPGEYPDFRRTVRLAADAFKAHALLVRDDATRLRLASTEHKPAAPAEERPRPHLTLITGG